MSIQVPDHRVDLSKILVADFAQHRLRLLLRSMQINVFVQFIQTEELLITAITFELFIIVGRRVSI